MQLYSLALITDLFILQNSSEITDHGGYLTIKTPTNPNYYWGNFLAFAAPPALGDVEGWPQLFQREFSTQYQNVSHMAFTWQGGEPGQQCLDLFKARGFNYQRETVLATRGLSPPQKKPAAIHIKPLLTHGDWRLATDLQILCAGPEWQTAGFKNFKTQQMHQYRKLSAAGFGGWFGAFVGNRLVADLGLFYDRGLARFQSVETHPEFRNRGICKTLVVAAFQSIKASQSVPAKEHTEADMRFVMVADPDYHAITIYQSLGFAPVEIHNKLLWTA